jgi:hypothetical protein
MRIIQGLELLLRGVNRARTNLLDSIALWFFGLENQ